MQWSGLPLAATGEKVVMANKTNGTRLLIGQSAVMLMHAALRREN